jgi:hypothetical protein
MRSPRPLIVYDDDGRAVFLPGAPEAQPLVITPALIHFFISC